MKLGTLLLAFGAVTAVIPACSLVEIDREYSAGDRVGNLSKFSYKGTLGALLGNDTCKSWEGELATDNFRAITNADGSKSMSNNFAFSVRKDNTEVIEQLKAAQQSGARVKLTYSQILKNGSCTSDTDYFITKVEPVTGPAATPKLVPQS